MLEKTMDVKLGVSNRHVHLTKEDFDLLFGNDCQLEVDRYLFQPQQFASTLFVDIKTEKNIIKRVRVLGPFRNYTQVEISKTDAYKLGLNPPIVDSGDLLNAEEIEIIGPNGSIKRKSAIIANRHIHLTKQQKIELGLDNVDRVSVLFEGEKTTLFYDVKLKVLENAKFELHLDTDDANGALLKTGDYGKIIMKQQNY